MGSWVTALMIGIALGFMFGYNPHIIGRWAKKHPVAVTVFGLMTVAVLTVPNTMTEYWVALVVSAIVVAPATYVAKSRLRG